MEIKNYKCKRPKQGYNTEKERQLAKWSDVSDWEVFYQNKKIGCIYYVGTQLVSWGWHLDKPDCKGEAFTKKEALWDLALTYEKERVS